MHTLKKIFLSVLATFILLPTLQAQALTKATILKEYGYDTREDTEQAVNPRLKRVYATKESFDPGSNEKTHIVFTLNTGADVTVSIHQKSREIVELMNEKDQSAGTYAIEWDGYEALDKAGNYTYKIFVKNDQGTDEATSDIEVQDDTKTNRKPNIYADSTDQIPFRPEYNQLGISFRTLLDSEVTIEIRDEHRVIATVIEKNPLVEGAHTIYWDGRDKNGDIVDDGLYQYKIIAENFQGKDVEFGNFEVQDASQTNPDRCGNFEDITRYNQYCKAIKWAAQNDIFQGYFDGSFRPNQAINRAEALKAILKSFNVTIRQLEGSNFGFADVDKFAWYNSYIGYALTLGIVQGYSDSTFRPKSSVKRVEALKILLEAAEAVDGIAIPTHLYGQPYYDTPNTAGAKWYMSYAWFAKIHDLNDNDYYFYPDNAMTRGELADLLYRYHLK